ncbi:dTDP-4-dehydrorhamnose 3,5-epimerase [Variovorax sp. YR750]|uniref:dTDP-4-dehydrorhamnose 3,5-epimerase family protein n=1 Tax=Variovorax sp. YR750 TaxID=1884384 RepID=UPI0008AD41ED|nr:dTDP-4-dehydrorhamnose 3,5-epimerase [Variovorax sp. YR750]MDP9605603.1 dTDP-4-dehydrorhamnose 3,5-epimerase [Variovorax paradoxus]SEL16462.1 dTDP-4-dehydrorhamnose 3,5-epimerase [Variovorax sp. YR750]
MIHTHQITLRPHEDARGSVTELFRECWSSGDEPSPVQWNLLRSAGNVLRGVHVHLTHFDNLVVLEGTMHLGLCDLRADSPSFGRGSLVELDGKEPKMVVIPPGVAHGFYFDAPCLAIYGMSHYWDPVSDELGCRWDDPRLNIPWPASCVSPELSARDRNADSLDALLQKMAAAEATS